MSWFRACVTASTLAEGLGWVEAVTRERYGF